MYSRNILMMKVIKVEQISNAFFTFYSIMVIASMENEDFISLYVLCEKNNYKKIPSEMNCRTRKIKHRIEIPN